MTLTVRRGEADVQTGRGAELSRYRESAAPCHIAAIAKLRHKNVAAVVIIVCGVHAEIINVAGDGEGQGGALNVAADGNEGAGIRCSLAQCGNVSVVAAVFFGEEALVEEVVDLGVGDNELKEAGFLRCDLTGVCGYDQALAAEVPVTVGNERGEGLGIARVKDHALVLEALLVGGGDKNVLRAEAAQSVAVGGKIVKEQLLSGLGVVGRTEDLEARIGRKRRTVDHSEGDELFVASHGPHRAAHGKVAYLSIGGRSGDV